MKYFHTKSKYFLKDPILLIAKYIKKNKTIKLLSLLIEDIKKTQNKNKTKKERAKQRKYNTKK